MKIALFATGLLASAALAQPHGHSHGGGFFRRLRRGHVHAHANQHDKRAIKTEWVVSTVYETVTEIIDDKTTETIRPSKFTPPKAAAATTTTQIPGQFFEGASSPPPAPPAETPKPAAPAPPAPAPPVAAPAPAPAAPAPEPVRPPAPQIQVAQPVAAAPAAANSHTGELTFFQVGLGACGFDDAGKDLSENIVALSHLIMGEQSNGNPYCGRSITVSYGGKTVQAVVRDKCMGCAVNNIDGTEKLFTEFNPLTTGRFQVQWWFND